MKTDEMDVTRLFDDGFVDIIEESLTAAGEVNLGGMIALMPTAEDANALALDVDGAEPASELHTTLLFLGDANLWGEEGRDLLRRVVEEIVERYVAITTETFSVNIFNPSSDDFDTAVVLGVRGSDLLVALHKAITGNVVDVFDDEVPEQHTPWVPHITLAYSDEMSVVKQAMKKLGPVTFDRIRVVFAGEITDFPLGAQDADDPVVAAGKKQFKPSEHPRDADGKFAKVPGTKGIVDFLKGDTDVLPFDDLGPSNPPEIDLSPGSAGPVESDVIKKIQSGDFSGLKKVGGKAGSNEGGFYEAPDGSRWYVKKQKTAKHAQNERDASLLYRAAGIDVPEVIIGEGAPGLSSGTHTATRLVDVGETTLSSAVNGNDTAKIHAIREGFAVDALLANWDVAGTGFDNIVFDAQGKPHRIDVGGALAYRAQGTAKGGAFGTDVGEWSSLRSTTQNPFAAKIFKGMTTDELKESVKRVEDLTPEKIREIIKDKKLADKLVARRESLLKLAQQEGVSPDLPSDIGFHPIDAHLPGDLDDDGELSEAEATALHNKAMFGDEPSIDESLSPTDAFKKHMADKKNAPTAIDQGSIFSGEEYDYAAELQENIWDLVVTSKMFNDGDVILKGTSLDGKEMPLKIIVQDYDTGQQLAEYQFEDGDWHLDRTWESKDEFDAAYLEEYDVNKKSAVPTPKAPTMTAMDPVHPDKFSDTGAPHSKLWDQMSKGIFAIGEGIAGGEDPVTGDYHRLVGKLNADGEWVLHDQVEGADGKFFTVDKYTSLDEFQQADYSWMGVGKPMTPPGPIKSVTTPSAVAKPLPKKVPKLTNAIIYGKYQDGEVIATSGNDEWRAIYKNNKIHIEFKKDDGTWSGAPYGKAEAYKKLQGIDAGSGWYLGELTPAAPPTSAPIVVKTMTELVPMDNDYANTVIHGKYADGQVIAFYKHNDIEARWVWDANSKMYLSQVKSKKTGVWETKNSSPSAETVASNITAPVFNAGGWYKGEEPSLGVDVPSTTSATPPAAPLDLPTTILHGKYADGQVIARFKNSAGESQWIWDDMNKKYVKRTKSGLTGGVWQVKVTTSDPQKVVDSLTAAKTSKWVKGDEPKFGVDVPSATPSAMPAPTLSAVDLLTTKAANPTSGLSLEETIKQGVYKDDDVVAMYNKSIAGTPLTRIIFNNGKFVKQTKTSTGTWQHAKTYDDENHVIAAMAAGSGIWSKVDEPSGGIKAGFTPKPAAVMTPAKAAAIKKIFSDDGVKWHTNASDMVDALAKAIKAHPEFTPLQILAAMDETTSTKTSKTPFTDKLQKYGKTLAGKSKLSYTLSIGPTLQPLTKAGVKYSPGTPTLPVVNIEPSTDFPIRTPLTMKKIQEEMHAQHGAWTASQSSALRTYTGGTYSSMNGCLRKPSTCTESIKKTNQNAIDGMRPITKAVRVHRGSGWSAFGLGAEKLSTSERIKLLQDLEGKTVQEDGFLSTSAGGTAAFSGELKLTIDVPVGTPAAWVKEISLHKSENELLLAPGLKYRIKKVVPSSYSTEVHLEVVG